MGNNQKYGNPTLGMALRFLREIAGDDILFEIYEQKNKENSSVYPIKEKDSFRKQLDRFCNEIGTKSEPIKDYQDYKITDNLVFVLLANFFYKLENQFSIPNEFIDCTNYFFESLYDSVKQFSFGKYGKLYFAANFETKIIVLYLLLQCIILVISTLEEKYGKDKTKQLVKIYLENNFYDEFVKIKGNDSFGNLKNIQKVLKNLKTGKQFLNWNDVKDFLGYCPENLKLLVFSRYFFTNLELSLKKVFSTDDKDLVFMKEILNDYSENDDNCKNFTDKSIKKFLTTYKEPFDKASFESGNVFIAHKSIIESFAYKRKSDDTSLYKLFEEFKKSAPISSQFFIPWFKAFISVQKRDFEAAMDFFREAFYHKYLAGDYLKEFLEMAFCFANYYEADWTTTRKSLTKENNIMNPIRCNAKMYLNFGYAIGLFPKDSSDAYFEAYNSQEYFYSIFPIECFIDEETARKEMEKEFENKTVKIETGGRDENEFKRNHPYEVLSKLTGKKRTTLISEKSLFTLNTDHNPKQKELYAPLALCLKYGKNDSRLLDLAEDWLSEKDFDISIVSYNGVTALCEAFVVFRELQFGIFSDIDYSEIEISVFLKNIDRYKRIIENLIEKTSYETDLKFGDKVPVMKFAIETFNFDWVKKLSEKISDDDFQNYKVDAYLSPLIYTICRKEPVNFGLEKYIRKQKDWYIPCDLSINEFGLTREEKAGNSYFSNRDEKDKSRYHMEHWKDILTDEDEKRFLSNYGCEKSWRIQVSEFDKMIDYFISRIKDIDFFRTVIRADGNSFMLFSALMYAGAKNDSDTCRKLLNKRAKFDGDDLEFGVLNLEFSKISYRLKMNFINVCIEYKSWETLKMFLTEFKNLAKKSMKKDEYEMTSFMHFAVKVHEDLIWCGKERQETRPIIELLKPLFIACGADPDEQTILGKVNDLI